MKISVGASGTLVQEGTEGVPCPFLQVHPHAMRPHSGEYGLTVIIRRVI